MKNLSTTEKRQLVHLRIPDDLHEMVKKFAQEEERDINSAYVRLIRKSFEKMNRIEECLEKLCQKTPVRLRVERRDKHRIEESQKKPEQKIVSGLR